MDWFLYGTDIRHEKVNHAVKSWNLIRQLMNTAKNTVFHLISSYGNFVEKHSFRIVSGESPEIMRKLCPSTKLEMDWFLYGTDIRHEKVNHAVKSWNLIRQLMNTAKNTVFHLISSYGNFVEKHSFRIVSGESPEIMRKLCPSTKFPCKEIRWNYDIFRSGTYTVF